MEELETMEMGRTVPKRKKDNSWKKFKSSDVILNPERRSDADPLYLYRFHIFVCETKRCQSYEWYIGSKDWKDGRKCRKCTVSVMPCETFLGLTPYQGDLRVFGLFRCQKCRRYWKSAYSWANTPQECETCEIDVYPYKQCYLTFNNNPDEVQRMNEQRMKGGHQIRLCEVCRSNTAAGGNCLCNLRNPKQSSDGRSSAGNSSSGVSSAENVNEDVEEVIEVSLKSIEEAELEKNQKQKRRRFYFVRRANRRIREEITSSSPLSSTSSESSSGLGIGYPRRRSVLDRPMGRPMMEDRPMERSLCRPVERSMERSLERPVERSIARPLERPMDRSAVRPMDRSTTRRPLPPPLCLPKPPVPQYRIYQREPGVLTLPRPLPVMISHSHAQKQRFVATHHAPPPPITRCMNDPTIVNIPARADINYSDMDLRYKSKTQVELLYDKMKLLMV